MRAQGPPIATATRLALARPSSVLLVGPAAGDQSFAAFGGDRGILAGSRPWRQRRVHRAVPRPGPVPRPQFDRLSAMGISGSQSTGTRSASRTGTRISSTARSMDGTEYAYLAPLEGSAQEDLPQFRRSRRRHWRELPIGLDQEWKDVGGVRLQSAVDRGLDFPRRTTRRASPAKSRFHPSAQLGRQRLRLIGHGGSWRGA